ncbi:hypothetical protein ACFPPD_24125 [Cohnella suwonensis]|uniref:DUF948 domain-containing protein n=1 Tax=Cohnella suwonensis TaxID=696072 RepID=A0ABW0M493_9BACL
MAWELAGYAIAAAAAGIAIAIAFGIAKAVRALARMEAVLDRVGKEAESALRHCRKLSEEAEDAIRASRQRMQGFATFAEGARAIGEAAQTAARSAMEIAELYRDCLTSPFHTASPSREADGEPVRELKELGRKLWALWRRRTDGDETSGSKPDAGTSAEPSEGE